LLIISERTYILLLLSLSFPFDSSYLEGEETWNV